MLEQKKVFELISRCSKWDGYTFDPGSYIRAVNILHQESKSEVIEQFRDYVNSLEMSGIGDNVFFLLRLLFEPENGRTFPSVPMGKPVDSGEANLANFPLYPLALVQDVPLLISSGYILGGKPGSPLGHIAFCEVNCQLRAKDLRPPENPLGLADELINSLIWYQKTEGYEGEEKLATLRAQLLRLIRGAYQVQEVDDPDFYGTLKNKTVWEKHLEAFQKLKASWDSTNNSYK